MINLGNVENEKEYYKKLNFSLSMANMWNSLQTKSDYGTTRSELGYQAIAKSMAGEIAEGISANPDLAEALVTCQASFFPRYGNAGKKAIMEYLAAHGINFTEEQLAVQFVEEQISSLGNVVTPELDRAIGELFNHEKEPAIPEVKIAKLCADTIRGIKRIERSSTIPPVNLLYEISQDTIDGCKREGMAVKSSKLDELLSILPEDRFDEAELTEEEKKGVFEDIDFLIDLFDLPKREDGIYEYIAAGGSER